MPPRCPECGRFLSKAFVEALVAEPAPCPRCETRLEAELFHGADAPAASEPPPESVRPPDLPPDEVRPPSDRDPLAGWDRGDEPSYRTHLELVEGRADGTVIAAPVGTALAIVGGGVLGGLVGGLATRQHRSVGAVIGTLAGASAVVLGARALGIPLNDEA